MQLKALSFMVEMFVVIILGAAGFSATLTAAMYFAPANTIGSLHLASHVKES
jgi:hypothetical protein